MALVDASIHPNSIECALSFETGIPIISKEECDKAIAAMQERFAQEFPHMNEDVSVVPILRSGGYVGRELIAPFRSQGPEGATLNPMRMSYYVQDGNKLEEPICLLEPNIAQIARRPHVAFVEAVVESQGTIKAAMERIRQMLRDGGVEDDPLFHTYALVSKTGDKPVAIPNLVAMFDVDPSIWVYGRGCDSNNRGRDLQYIGGMLSPYAQYTPQPPYYHPLF